MFELINTALDGTFRLIAFLFKIISSPGIVLHEYAHLRCCHLFEVKVYDYKLLDLFSFSYVGGYVEHEQVNDPFKQFVISYAPLLVNSAATLLFGIVSVSILPISSIAAKILFWLAFFFGFHALPSYADARAFLNVCLAGLKTFQIFSIILFPFAIICVIFAFVGQIPKINALLRISYPMIILIFFTNISQVTSIL
ncbi:MAG: hypothetical protein Q7S22_00705 [Candidatus Micrarchaeota archaeon]|nr:hypothetical protein [Candidatus Micrarchaeota archaeon]